jgi:predicted transcriptional regulator/adenylate kinase
MSKAVLISIHPEHVDNILSGKKVFEYRKVLPTQDVTHLVLYSTSPVKKIIAVAEITDRLVGPPSRVWSETAYGSGITRQFYRSYFSGEKKASCFALGKVYELKTPLDLSQLSGCKTPPQSFRYLNEKDAKKVFNRVPNVSAVQPSVIFVGGIHGVGKTTKCNLAFLPLGFQCVTASSIIKGSGQISDVAKRVQDVTGNQSALVKQVRRIKKSYHRLLLDGHFTVINDESKIEPIDIDVFRALDPAVFVFVKGKPKDIANRLRKRDGKKWNAKFLNAFQQEEESHAYRVANELSVPLLIIDGDIKPSSLAKLVSDRLFDE